MNNIEQTNETGRGVMVFRRTFSRGVATVTCAIGLILGAQGEALASTQLILHDGYNREMARAVWNADPAGSDPGDSFRACDYVTDGLYVLVGLDIDRDGNADRWATTKGHKADYCSPWTSGNIKENTEVWVEIWSMGPDGNYGYERFVGLHT